ncbi:MAG: hypothetical protein Phog2KO_48730 [Phototrophicaceae bacterium]
MIIIQCNQIQEITKHSVSYIDVLGNEVLIDFHTCYLNYVNPRLTYKAYIHHKAINPSFKISLKSYIEKLQSFKSIGSRNTVGYTTEYKVFKTYITFYTNPTTLIEFEDMNKYSQIIVNARRNRWHIRDET